MKYLSRNNYGYYSFRIKVPKIYRCYFNQTEIIKSLKTKSYNEARKFCTLLTSETQKLLQTLKLGIFSTEQEKSLVNQYLSKVLSKKTTHLEDTEEIITNNEKTASKVQEQGKSIEDIVSMYIKNIPSTTSQAKVEAYKAFFKDILFELVDKKSLIKNIDREKLLEIREIIQGLPRRNIQKYRALKVSKIIKMNIPQEDIISFKTQNDYLKWIMSLFSFALKYGYLDFNPSVDLSMKKKNNAKDEREVFSDDELKNIISKNTENDDMKLFHHTLFYTVMIISEFKQVKITKVDDVLCFDLTNSNLKLKTMARHRLIPIHSHLLRIGIIDRLSFIQKEYTADYLSRWGNNFINEHINNSSKKVLYSFRHTFATKLQNNIIEENIISQLMGHAKKGQTLGRYGKGFDVKNLSEAIESLIFPNN